MTVLDEGGRRRIKGLFGGSRSLGAKLNPVNVAAKAKAERELSNPPQSLPKQQMQIPPLAAYSLAGGHVNACLMSLCGEGNMQRVGFGWHIKAGLHVWEQICGGWRVEGGGTSRVFQPTEVLLSMGERVIAQP